MCATNALNEKIIIKVSNWTLDSHCIHGLHTDTNFKSPHKIAQFANLHLCAVLCGVERTCLKHVVGSNIHTCSRVSLKMFTFAKCHIFFVLSFSVSFSNHMLCTAGTFTCTTATSTYCHSLAFSFEFQSNDLNKSFNGFLLLLLLLLFGPLSWIRSH